MKLITLKKNTDKCSLNIFPLFAQHIYLG